MRKALVAIVCLALMGCGGGETADTTTSTEATIQTTTSTSTTTSTTTTTVPPTTTTTLSEEELAQIEHDSDVALIKALWRGASDSWFQGADAGAQYIVDNNHPVVECVLEDYQWDAPENYQEEYVLDAETIERDDAWTFRGADPEGRVYIHQMTITYSSAEFPPESELIEAHSAIHDGRAYFFISGDGCP